MQSRFNLWVAVVGLGLLAAAAPGCGRRLDAGPQLDALERDARRTAERLDKKVMSVTFAGEKLFDRHEKTV